MIPRIITYYADATGVLWFAMRNKKHVTPWSMSPFDPIINWIKGNVYERTGNVDDKLWG